MSKFLRATLFATGLLALAGPAAAAPQSFGVGLFFGAQAPSHAAPLAPVVPHARAAYVERSPVHRASSPVYQAYRAPRGRRFYEERDGRRGH